MLRAGSVWHAGFYRGRYLQQPDIKYIRGEAQLYHACVHLQVDGEATSALPKGVRIPETFQYDQPGQFALVLFPVDCANLEGKECLRPSSCTKIRFWTTITRIQEGSCGMERSLSKMDLRNSYSLCVLGVGALVEGILNFADNFAC